MKADKYNNPSKMVTNAYLTETCLTMEEGKRILTHRLRPEFCSDEECVESFHEAAVLWRELKHPHLLRIGQATSNREKAEVVMEPFNGVTLEEYLYENPSFVAERKELERIIGEVLDALEYLHGRGICQLDLHPRNILLTKGERKVKLVNSLFTYSHLAHSLGLEPNGFVAPELFGESPVSDLVACDIYALGKFIEYLYDMATLPFSYRKAVQLATSATPDRRPGSIAEFRKLVAGGQRMLTAYRGVAWTAAALMAVGLLFWLTTSGGEEEIHFVEPTANNTYIYDSISGQSYYLNDSAMAAREAAIEREKGEQMKMYDRKLNEIFKKSFREKATPVINNIYSPKHMNSETGIFTSVSTQGMQELKKVQEELARQYELDPISTAQVAAEVIEELTRQRMNELRKE